MCSAEGRHEASRRHEASGYGLTGLETPSGSRNPSEEVRRVTCVILLCFCLFLNPFTQVNHQPLLFSSHGSNALEELSVRASIALGQKKVQELLTNDGAEDEDFEREYTALSAQVVSHAKTSYRYRDLCTFNTSCSRFEFCLFVTTPAGQGDSQNVRCDGGSQQAGTSS